MADNQFHLLTSRRFLPLFVTQFLGAFNDNVFKNALVILITFRTAQDAAMDAQLLVTLAAGLFVLPFFLFSATAGQLADKFEKSRLVRIIKLVEIGLMVAAAVGFFIESVPFLLTLLFLMGTQSTFFGPLKYGILPDHLRDDELIGGNALFEAATFLAILAGTIAGSLLILSANGVLVIAAAIIAVAIAGWLASRGVPHAAAGDPTIKVDANILRETWRIVRHAQGNRPVFLSILGISWFWLIGATFLVQFPTFVKDVIGGDEHVVTLFLTVFSVGIGAGSLLCNRLLHGDISARHVPLAAIGISAFAADLYFATAGQSAAAATALLGVGDFLTGAGGWRVCVDLLGMAIAGGIFIVPLYAILQHDSEEEFRSRMVACNNILNALGMVISTALTMLAFQLGMSIPELFLAAAICNLPAVAVISRLTPDSRLATLVRMFRL
jgi:acyl-[acyl-carrier-protein]-phospholipid O-acyltransferase/long-chain-fatty-acid--[acyl-carrier-protein] ligase